MPCAPPSASRRQGAAHWSVDAAAAPEPAAEPIAPVEPIPEILEQLFLKPELVRNFADAVSDIAARCT
jgi:hypothetical protein